MNNIHFHDDFYTDINLGCKSQTIRYQEPKYCLGSSYAIFDNSPCVSINILYLDFKSFRDLSLQEVKKDGFESKELLWTTLLRFYPDLKISDELMIVGFKLANKTNM